MRQRRQNMESKLSMMCVSEAGTFEGAAACISLTKFSTPAAGSHIAVRINDTFSALPASVPCTHACVGW